MSEQELYAIYDAAYDEAAAIGVSTASCRAVGVKAVASHVRAPLEKRIAALETQISELEQETVDLGDENDALQNESLPEDLARIAELGAEIIALRLCANYAYQRQVNDDETADYNGDTFMSLYADAVRVHVPGVAVPEVARAALQNGGGK